MLIWFGVIVVLSVGFAILGVFVAVLSWFAVGVGVGKVVGLGQFSGLFGIVGWWFAVVYWFGLLFVFVLLEVLLFT